MSADTQSDAASPAQPPIAHAATLGHRARSTRPGGHVDPGMAATIGHLMSLDPAVIAEARELVVAAGLKAFQAAAATPPSTGGQPVAIALIDCGSRDPGTPNFDNPDPDRPGVLRSRSILEAVHAGIALPPVVLFQAAGDTRYELIAGFHRFHLWAALGYTHVPAEISNWKFGMP